VLFRLDTDDFKERVWLTEDATKLRSVIGTDMIAELRSEFSCATLDQPHRSNTIYTFQLIGLGM